MVDKVMKRGIGEGKRREGGFVYDRSVDRSVGRSDDAPAYLRSNLTYLASDSSAHRSPSPSPSPTPNSQHNAIPQNQSPHKSLNTPFRQKKKNKNRAKSQHQSTLTVTLFSVLEMEMVPWVRLVEYSCRISLPSLWLRSLKGKEMSRIVLTSTSHRHRQTERVPELRL